MDSTDSLTSTKLIHSKSANSYNKLKKLVPITQPKKAWNIMKMMIISYTMIQESVAISILKRITNETDAEQVPACTTGDETGGARANIPPLVLLFELAGTGVFEFGGTRVGGFGNFGGGAFFGGDGIGNVVSGELGLGRA